MGVLDVNIPDHITRDDALTYRNQPEGDRAQGESEKLVGYLWENYIEPYDHEKIVFIGIGNAFQGIVKFLSERGLSYSSGFSVKNSPLTFTQRMRSSRSAP